MMLINSIIPPRHHREADGLPSTAHEDVVDYSNYDFGGKVFEGVRGEEWRVHDRM